MRDILLQLVTYPDPVPDEALAWGAGLAGVLKGRLSTVAFEIDIRAPSNPLANALLDLPAMAAAERAKSAAVARRYAELAAGMKAGVGEVDGLIRECLGHDTPSLAAQYARLHDLTIVPLLQAQGQQQEVAESVAFSGGGPAMVVPHHRLFERPALRRMAVAWDFSAPAASALAHAMPLLRLADEVVLLTVTNEKPIPAIRSANRVIERLRVNDVVSRVHEEDAQGRKIGEVLTAYAEKESLDLLVMGAFGHSRFREFVLGGATRSILQSTPCPVLMAH